MEIEDILKIKNLITSNRIDAHNLLNVNTLNDKQMREIFENIKERTNEIDDILKKYYMLHYDNC